MSTQPYVLACIDGSSYSKDVCSYSAWIARTINAPLTFLHTIEQSSTPEVSNLSGAIGLGASEDLLNELTTVEQVRRKLLIQKGKLMLEAAKVEAQNAGVSDVNLSQQHGSLPEALINKEEESRFLVVGIRGENHENNQKDIGATLEIVIRSLHKPILVVNKTFTPPQKIMLAYNASAAAKKALDIVASSILFKNIECHIVHVGTADSTDGLLDEAKNVLLTAGLKVTTCHLSGQVDEALAGYQLENDIDLTVMGAFSHNRVRDFLIGSFTAKMLAATQRPLLLLR